MLWLLQLASAAADQRTLVQPGGQTGRNVEENGVGANQCSATVTFDCLEDLTGGFLRSGSGQLVEFCREVACLGADIVDAVAC